MSDAGELIISPRVIAPGAEGRDPLTRVQELQAKYDKKLKKKGLAAKYPGSSEPPQAFYAPRGA